MRVRESFLLLVLLLLLLWRHSNNKKRALMSWPRSWSAQPLQASRAACCDVRVCNSCIIQASTEITPCSHVGILKAGCALFVYGSDKGRPTQSSFEPTKFPSFPITTEPAREGLRGVHHQHGRHQQHHQQPRDSVHHYDSLRDSQTLWDKVTATAVGDSA